MCLASSVCTVYRIFKIEFKMEPYLKVLPKNLALKMLKFRCIEIPAFQQ